jgi:hypothetical protein
MNRLSAAVLICSCALILVPSLGLAQSRQEGMRLHKQAEKIRKRAQTHADLKQAVRKRIGQVLIGLGNVYLNWGQYDKAVSY